MSEVVEQERVSITNVVPYDDKYESQVLRLAREMMAESISHHDMQMDEQKLVVQLRASINSPDTVYLRLAVRGNEVLGGFFGIITTVYFTQELAAKDMAWFVTKTRRGSLAAVRLVQDFEEWAKARGARKFFLGQSTGVNIETTRLLYERLGYRVVGYNTVKEC